MDMALEFTQGSIFDLFGGAPEPTIAEVETKAEPKKPAAAKSGTSSSSSSKKKKGGRKMDAPVTVFGTGWKYVFGAEGERYTPEQVLKATYDAGYRSIACAGQAWRYKKDVDTNNVLYVKDIKSNATNADINAPEVEIMLGQKACQLAPANFEGKDAAEITVADVISKFVELNPEFKGCSIAYNAAAKTALPVFEKETKIEEAAEDTVRIWSDSQILEFSKAEAIELYKGYYTARSEDGIYFAMPQLDIKKGESVYITEDIFGLTKMSAEKAKEFFKLPATIWLEQYGQKVEAKPEFFSGKEKVTKEDVINFLKPNYKAFQSSSRTFDAFYDDDQNLISIYMVSGRKGAAAGGCVVPISDVVRTEETAIGTFTAVKLGNGFGGFCYQRSIPKIPGRILENIVDYFKRDLRKEAMVQVYYNPDNGTFFLQKPFQVVDKVSVQYIKGYTPGVLVLTAHSHNTMSAQFSATDNEDESVGIGLYMVCGKLHTACPQINLRAGMDGLFGAVDIGEVFEIANDRRNA